MRGREFCHLKDEFYPVNVLLIATPQGFLGPFGFAQGRLYGFEVT
jgi:hypothetical protein